MTYDIVPPHPFWCVVVGLFSPRKPWTARRRAPEDPTESVPVRRREDIGRIRDCGTYFSGYLEEGMRSHIPRRNYRDGADGEEKAWGQMSWCSMAERVAAAREVTSSLL